MFQVGLAVFLDVRLEAFNATEPSETFSGRQLRQDAKAFQRSGSNSVPVFTV